MTEQKTDQQIVEEYKTRLLKKREYAKDYYKKNKLKISENQKKRYLENKEKHKEYYNNNLDRAREYYNNNRDKIINRAKKHYYDNKMNKPTTYGTFDLQPIVENQNNEIDQKNEQ
jgi:hypothetical protein